MTRWAIRIKNIQFNEMKDILKRYGLFKETRRLVNEKNNVFSR